MNLSKWLVLSVMAVSLPGCLVALSSTQSANAAPGEWREFDFYNDAAHTTLVGQGYTDCSSWRLHMSWGTSSAHSVQTAYGTCD